MVEIKQSSDSGAAGREVDERAEILIMEFDKHYREVVAGMPSAKGRRDHVFQGWAMQKLAGLQLAVEELARAVNADD